MKIEDKMPVEIEWRSGKSLRMPVRSIKVVKIESMRLKHSLSQVPIELMMKARRQFSPQATVTGSVIQIGVFYCHTSRLADGVYQVGFPLLIRNVR